MPQSAISQLRDKFRHRHVMLSLFRFLGRHHIEIDLYYVNHRSLRDGLEPSMDRGLGPVTTCLLSPAEIEEVYAHPDGEVWVHEKKTLLDEGCLCFGLKLNGEIAAYTWCNLYRCHSRLTKFPLKEDEAYICSTATLKAYRGKNLAPLLGHELHRYLTQEGRTNFYSLTEYFNTPARRYRDKLGARPLRLTLHIRLGSRFEKDITLKRFRI
jgi:GNAT superfamily N-acetyltransferase